MIRNIIAKRVWEATCCCCVVLIISLIRWTKMLAGLIGSAWSRYKCEIVFTLH